MNDKNRKNNHMKKLIPMLLLWSSALAALAQGVVVVPNGFGNVEGNSSTSDPFTSSSFRLQMVIDASQFAIPAGASGRVDGIAFRVDGASTGGALYSFGGCSVTLSTTPVGADGLSAVFADNVGANPVTMYSGAGSFGSLYNPGQNPQFFGQTIPPLSAFWYNPQQGNLLLDIRGGGGLVLFPGSLDAQAALGDSVSRVFANSSSATSGSADTLGLVTRFNFTVVPEPSIWALLGFGSTVLWLWRRR